MNVLYKGARLLKDMYDQLNPATLTGAIDILVIEQEDGTLTSSPFHVRFGKLGVLRAKEKLVNITINEENVDLHMKLGDQGEAFFVVETDDEEIPPALITSPLPSRPSTPCSGVPESTFTLTSDDASLKRKRKKRRKRRSFTSTSPSSEMNLDHSATDSDDEIASKQENLNMSSLENATSLPQIIANDLQKDEIASPALQIVNVFSDSELQQDRVDKISLSSSPHSDSELAMREEVPPPIGWEWGQLPGDGDVTKKNSSLTIPEAKISKIMIEKEENPADTRIVLEAEEKKLPEVGEPQVNGQDVLVQEKEIVGMDIPTASSAPPVSLTPKNNSPSKSSKGASRPGLYLDEILDLEPNEANLYLISKNQEDQPEIMEEGGMDNARSRTPPASYVGSDAGVDSGTDCMISDDTTDVRFSEMRMSLCGAKFEDGKLTVDQDKFDEKEVSYDDFMKDPVGITNNSELVILSDGMCFDWATAGPLLLSKSIFKKPLSQETVERVIDQQMGKKMRKATGGRLSWFWRRASQRESTGSISEPPAAVKDKEITNATQRVTLSKSISASPTVPDGKGKDESSSCEDEVYNITQNKKDLRRAQTLQHLGSSTSLGKTMKKTTRLTSDQLKSLNLQPGANEIEFSVTSQYQGTSRCFATAFLWRYSDKLIVSDIDGTITKSDVFGQILPVVGKDWTQGGVAQLYHNISKNGYKFIYLSSRAIGQAGMTKGYLNWINQQGVCLPAGPLFLSPTSLMRAFRTEVIEKNPEKFKIECLKDITSLFPDGTHSLVAGFGNKINDVHAYTAVGVPVKRIFTINHRGELRQQDLQTYTTSYSALGDIVDTFFPALDSDHCQQFNNANDYSTFNYWRSSFPDIEDL